LIHEIVKAENKNAVLGGNITKSPLAQMKQVAKAENLSPEEICLGLAQGTIAVPCNPLHKNLVPVGFGQGLKVKVNANIGTSADFPAVSEELKKLTAALAAKTDALMDLSTGGNIAAIRRSILMKCPVPLGTVPVYQAIVEKRMTVEGMFSVVEEQAQDGVDFMTIHCGVNFETIGRLKKQPRLMDVVSRGGALMMKWILDSVGVNDKIGTPLTFFLSAIFSILIVIILILNQIQTETRTIKEFLKEQGFTEDKGFLEKMFKKNKRGAVDSRILWVAIVLIVLYLLWKAGILKF